MHEVFLSFQLKNWIFRTKKRVLELRPFLCGECRIRTYGTSRYNSFQDCRNRPLCQFSGGKISNTLNTDKHKIKKRLKKIINHWKTSGYYVINLTDYSMNCAFSSIIAQTFHKFLLILYLSTVIHWSKLKYWDSK